MRVTQAWTGVNAAVKELILLMLVGICGINLAQFMTPVQLIVLAIIGMLYIPCLSTIAALAKESGWKTSTVITLANLGSAILIGGMASHLLDWTI